MKFVPVTTGRKIEPTQNNQYGFTPDRFDGWLWDNGDRVLISFVESKQPGKGHFSEMVRRIEESGKRVAVPTPLGKMEFILKKWGFAPHIEQDPMLGSVEIWERPT